MVCTGVYYHANGDKYVGNFKNGMQDGKGTFTWANGAVYEGSWKNNKRDGKGVYKWSNGDVYDGDWKDNRPNGQGTLKTVAGMQYKGGFVDGLEEGQGVQIDKDGNRFDGFFKQGKKNGPFVETDKDGKVYSDFIITKPQNSLNYFKPQLDFAHKHFETIWEIIEKMSYKISKMSFVQDMKNEERTKLDRYAVLKTLQDFQHFGTGRIEAPKFPKRRDGGWWFASATAFDAGYNMKEYNEASEYMIHGGHRTLEVSDIGRTKRVRFYEFDTTLWDSPQRYGGAYELYFKHIIPLLWSIYDGISLETSDIPNEFISYIPTLERLGVIGHTEDRLCVKIPVLKKVEYDEICAVIKNATEEIKTAIGEEFTAFIVSMKTPIPKHLTSVPELFRYHEATNYFVMAIVREAYNKGLHLKNVDYCCPPVVLVYEE